MLGAQQHCPANGEEGRKEDFFFTRLRNKPKPPNPTQANKTHPNKSLAVRKAFESLMNI